MSTIVNIQLTLPNETEGNFSTNTFEDIIKDVRETLDKLHNSGDLPGSTRITTVTVKGTAAAITWSGELPIPEEHDTHRYLNYWEYLKDGFMYLTCDDGYDIHVYIVPEYTSTNPEEAAREVAASWLNETEKVVAPDEDRGPYHYTKDHLGPWEIKGHTTLAGRLLVDLEPDRGDCVLLQVSWFGEED